MLFSSIVLILTLEVTLTVIDAVTNLLNSQRQEQERILKNIAAGMSSYNIHFMHCPYIALELSNDIKGERIRFVDAMKEATAINVQCALFRSDQPDLRLIYS